MKLIKPSVELLYLNEDALKLIEIAGRVCYKSEDKITETSSGKFVLQRLKTGHESVIEHSMATVRFICDRGVSHELVRHRLASISQESTRYCDYEGGHVVFIIPEIVKGCFPIVGDIIWDEARILKLSGVLGVNHPAVIWANSMFHTEVTYKRLRNAGWSPQWARSALTNSLKTEMVMTANFREWRHFFKLRTSAAAHPQMREVAITLLKEMQSRISVMFDDIVPEEKNNN
jgi:thymidylate synthase (FAD)